MLLKDKIAVVYGVGSAIARKFALEELTNMAAFLASDLANGMTGTVANLTLGQGSRLGPSPAA